MTCSAAQARLAAFKKLGRLPDGVSDGDMWEAQKTVDAIIHGPTGEKMLIFGRMSMFVPMNVPMKDYPPGFNMTKEGGKHNLEITENRLKFITLKAPVNETLDRADVERVAQAV